MKLDIYNTKNEKTGSIQVPAQFQEPVRQDLISRAVRAIQLNSRQPYGAFELAGKQHSTKLSRRRRKYKGAYGKGISRVPRKTLSRNGSQMYWVGAFAPGTVGGRQAHPPKSDKILTISINDAERQKAIRCALAATLNKDLVAQRGHKLPQTYPFVVSDDMESLAKTKDVVEAFKALGFVDELTRSSIRKVRAGKGTMRGRRYKTKVGPLLVVSDSCQAKLAARNIPGVQIATVTNLNASILAPGSAPGRITLFTESAMKKLAEQKLYM
ncbi:MAG: 50S ribosomal protein L4 [Candidatus Woesearchaeota archaeon]